MLRLRVGEEIERDALLRRLVDMQYTRNDLAFTRGTFRVRGDTIEIIPQYEELAVRIEMFGDEIEKLVHPAPADRRGDHARTRSSTSSPPPTTSRAPSGWRGPSGASRPSWPSSLETMERQGKLLEAQRLRMRTTYDLEMMRQVGTCSGIENYSRHIDGRAPGSAPNTLLDYFPEDFLLVLDESHQTVPQIGAMYEGDASRKRTLVEHGFRLPSALDNRPLKWEEFLERIGQTVYLSATPGPYELGRVRRRRGRAGHPAHRPGRPRGRWSSRRRARSTTWCTRSGCGPSGTSGCWSPRSPRRWPRTSPTTCSSSASGCATCTARWTPCAASSCCASCAMGEFDVLVGINLLREGLDLPEVSLVSHPRRRQGGLPALGDLADPDHRPRRPQRLRPGAHVRRHGSPPPCSGRSTRPTGAAPSRSPTTRHGIDPQPLRKKIADILDQLAREDADTAQLLGGGRTQSRGKAPVPRRRGPAPAGQHAKAIAGEMPRAQLESLIE